MKKKWALKLFAKLFDHQIFIFPARTRFRVSGAQTAVWWWGGGRWNPMDKLHQFSPPGNGTYSCLGTWLCVTLHEKVPFHHIIWYNFNIGNNLSLWEHLVNKKMHKKIRHAQNVNNFSESFPTHRIFPMYSPGMVLLQLFCITAFSEAAWLGPCEGRVFEDDREVPKLSLSTWGAL